MYLALITVLAALCVAYLCGFVTAWRLRNVHDALERDAALRASSLLGRT
jgi:hypothetical protein